MHAPIATADESQQEAGGGTQSGTDFSPPEFIVDLDQPPNKRWNHIVTPFVPHIRTCLDHIWETCGAFKCVQINSQQYPHRP